MGLRHSKIASAAEDAIVWQSVRLRAGPGAAVALKAAAAEDAVSVEVGACAATQIWTRL